MPIGSGLASSIGFAAETTYSTYAAPSRFLESTKPALAKVKNTTSGAGMAAGRMVAPAARRQVTTRAASGSVAMEVVDAGMGLLLAQVFGGAITPVQQAASTAYLQTHTLVDNFGRSLTAQVGVPDLGGVVRPYTFLGAKVTSAEFSCGIDDLLEVSLAIDAQDVSEAQSLVAPSYSASAAPFHFAQASLSIGALGSEAVVDGVRKVSLKVERPQKTDRFYVGGGGLKKEPITNNLVKITGSFETDFIDKTIFADRFRDDTTFSLIWTFTGPLIASTYYRQLRFAVPAAFLDDGTPTVDGFDVVNPKFSFVGLAPTSGVPITCTYQSVDTAL